MQKASRTARRPGDPQGPQPGWANSPACIGTPLCWLMPFPSAKMVQIQGILHPSCATTYPYALLKNYTVIKKAPCQFHSYPHTHTYMYIYIYMCIYIHIKYVHMYLYIYIYISTKNNNIIRNMIAATSCGKNPWIWGYRYPRPKIGLDDIGYIYIYIYISLNHAINFETMTTTVVQHIDKSLFSCRVSARLRAHTATTGPNVSRAARNASSKFFFGRRIREISLKFGYPLVNIQKAMENHHV